MGSGTLKPEDKARWHLERRTNKTGFLGVTYRRSDGYYVARVRVPLKKNKVYAGTAKTPEDAARCYDRKARELFGPTAVVNFPESTE